MENKTKSEIQKELVFENLNQYQEHVMALANSLDGCDTETCGEVRQHLADLVKSVNKLMSSFITHRDIMFEEHGFIKQ